MDPKSKKVLEQQGSSVAQAVKWIGGAIFGDPDEVLDEMAEVSEEDERARPRYTPPRRPPAGPRRRKRVVRPAPRDEIVEGILEDDDEDEGER